MPALCRLCSSLSTVARFPSARLHRTSPASAAAWELRLWSDRHRNSTSADRPRSNSTDSHSAPSRNASWDNSRSEGTRCRTDSGSRQASADRRRTGRSKEINFHLYKKKNHCLPFFIIIMSLSSLRTRTSISDSGFNPDFYFFYFISQVLSFLFQNVDFNQLWVQISNNNMNNNTSLKKSFFDIQFKTFFRLLLKNQNCHKKKKKIMFNLRICTDKKNKKHFSM